MIYLSKPFRSKSRPPPDPLWLPPFYSSQILTRVDLSWKMRHGPEVYWFTRKKQARHINLRGGPYQETILRSKTNTTNLWRKLKKELLVSQIMRRNLQLSQKIRLQSVYKSTRNLHDNRYCLKITRLQRWVISKQY